MFDRNTPIEKWCELCDALQVPPDAPIDNVILKAKRLREMAHQNNEELVGLLQGTKGLCERLLEKQTGEFEYTEEWANDLLQGTRAALAKAGK